MFLLVQISSVRREGARFRFAFGIKCSDLSTVQSPVEEAKFIHRTAEITDHEGIVVWEAFTVPIAQLSVPSGGVLEAAGGSGPF
jgi:hypothetical protein